MLEIFLLELNSKGLYYTSGKEKEKKSCCLVFPSSTKREIRKFHVVVVQPRLTNEQKSKSVMQVQSKPIVFMPFSLASPSSLFKLSMIILEEA